MNNEFKINTMLDLMKVKGAQYLGLNLPGFASPVNCVVLPVSYASPNGNLTQADGGVRMPRQWKDKDGKSHLSISLAIQLDRYGDTFYSSENVQKRYAGKDLPSHSVKIVLPEEVRELRIKRAIAYYNKHEELQPQGWLSMSKEEQERICGYELNKLLQLSNAYFAKMDDIKPESTAQVSAPTLDPSMQVEDNPFGNPYPPIDDLPF